MARVIRRRSRRISRNRPAYISGKAIARLRVMNFMRPA